ncbi:hypothetical protein ACLK1Z_03395 [Escherichia coli]
MHKVVCARPGPTSKADCLNNVLDAITQFNVAPISLLLVLSACAEDVISPMELRLFNYLVERKDLIQIPVYPFNANGALHQLTYIDRFQNCMAKMFRCLEPSPDSAQGSVGTCLRRTTVTALLADGDGLLSTSESTEHYDIGFT